MQIKIFNSKEELYTSAALQIFQDIVANPKMLLGLATGETMIPLYKKLHTLVKSEDLKSIQTINLDEYVGIQKTHPQSFYSFMAEYFFNVFNISENNIHFLNGVNDLNDEIHKMNHFLSENNIHTQLLGIGSNGHIAFNEPKTSFDIRTHLVALDTQTRLDNSRFFKSLQDVPTHALTLGIKDIFQSKHIIMIAIGQKKADAVNQMINGPITNQLPASVLQDHPSITVYLDSDAASML